MRKKLDIKNWLPFLLVIFISFFATRHLLLSGFLPTHDGEYHIIRLWQFDKMIKSGDFFPRWAADLNNGYGVPLFQFFYPLPNYIGEFFHLLGFSLVDSIKLVLASGLLISALTFYFWMRCFFKKWPALVGTIFYLLAPYHLVDVFIRGSVGEVWALALTPLVLFFTTRLVKAKKKERRKFLILNSTSLLFLLTSHNILGVLFFIFTFIYGIAAAIYFNKKALPFMFLSFILGFLLAGFFWLPAILESQYVTGLKIINYQDHFPALFQLLIPSWGSGFSVPGVADQLSFQIGIPHVLVFLAAFLLLVLKKRKDILLIFLLIISAITIFLMIESSLFVWRLLPFLTYFQYPWRLLSLVVLLSSFFAGYIADFKPKIAIPLLIFLSFIFYLPYTKPVVYKARDDSFYLNNPSWTQGTATLGNTFNTRWFSGNGNKKLAEEKVKIVKGQGLIRNLKTEPTKHSFIVEADSLLGLMVNVTYFPGWIVLLDNRQTAVGYKEGLIYFSVPEGKHSIIVRFENTPIRRIANTISVSSALLIVLLTVQQAEPLQILKHPKGAQLRK